MSRNRMSPAGERDLALMGLLVATLSGLVAVTGALMLGVAVTAALLGVGWAMPGLGLWVAGLVGLAAHPDRPGESLGAPWSTALAGHAVRYWVVTAVLVVVAAVVVSVVAVPVWRRFGPVQAGHASREDIHEELSVHAARHTAQWTRPDLTAADVRHAPLEEVGAPLHLSPFREPMCTPFENPTGTLAPTQSGKSRKDLVHKAIAAPGALLCSTTKPDLFEFSAVLRTRRANAGPVLLYDATGTVAWPAGVRWYPMEGCQDPQVAYQRADTMVEASSVALTNVGGNDKVFRERAKIVLQAYFLAANHHNRGVEDLVRWATSKPADVEPVKLLQQSGLTEYARNLRSEIGMVAETSDAVWLSVRRVLEPLMSPQLRHLCTPGPGEGFDARKFIAQGGSLYLIAGQSQAAQTAPILTALAEHWLTTAQEMALHNDSRRLGPPASAILDELTTATPIPKIPDLVADTAGRGVIIHWGAQSVAALEDAYDTRGARRLLENTTTLTVWGGVKDEKTLQWVSVLSGHHDRRRYQEQSMGMFGPGRTSVGTETVPTYRPGAVRRIRRGRVLVIHRHLDPVLAHVVDVSKRADWPSIRRHIQAVRDGRVPVGPNGRALAPPATGPDPYQFDPGQRGRR